MNLSEKLSGLLKEYGIDNDHLVREILATLLCDWKEEKLSYPNPSNVEYIVTKFNPRTQSLDIEGRDLIYTQLGDTHHGCQCAVSGKDESKEKEITNKLSQIVELFKDVSRLNVR